MATTEFVSEVRKIDSPIWCVYGFLSDFRKIGKVVDMAKEFGLPQDFRTQNLLDKMEGVSFTKDSCHIMLKNLGELVLSIVERDDPKLIKLRGAGAIPIEFNIWIQLLDNGPYDTRMKITFRGEMSLIVKMVMKGNIEKGIDLLSKALTKLPYCSIVNLEVD